MVYFLTIFTFVPLFYMVPVVGDIWIPSALALYKTFALSIKANPLGILILLQIIFWAFMIYFVSWFIFESKYIIAKLLK